LTIAVYAVAYDTVDSFIYLISAFMLFSLWLAVGTAILGQGVRRLAGRMVRLGAFQKQLYVGAFVVVALVVPTWSVATGWGELNLASNNEPASYAAATIAKAAGGVVLGEEPELFALVYEAQVGSPELDVMVVGPVMLQHDWYWDQLVQYYPDRMPSERPDTLLGRIEWVVAESLGLVPIFSTHDDRTYHKSFTLVEDGDLFRVDY
jgi:hypothetical protein